MTVFEEWLKDLDYTDFPSGLILAGENAGTRPYAGEIEEMLRPQGRINASAVFCVEDVPTICFVDGTTLAVNREERIELIRQRVWNQNLASVVLVLDAAELQAYSVCDRAAEPEALSRKDASDLGRWSAYEVQSAFIGDRLAGWFSPTARVDQRLLKNLRNVVQLLTKVGLPTREAEALMAQIIFLCYLEQREIVGSKYREKHQLDVLESYVHRRDGAGMNRLLKQLSTDFNGDFLNSKDGGAPNWAKLPLDAFPLLAKFLEAVDLETGQGSFWRYDFSHIPVELISSIYETLLKDRQGALGAYYTPRHLANLVTEQAFETFPDPSKCTVYDGACGSGILLTTAFRKMLRHAEVRAGDKLRLAERIKLMQTNIFGNDVDETACWISAFSLYLSLLEGLNPLDVESLQSDANLKLPCLIGPNLNIQKGYERGDFFSAANPFAGKKNFDIFLCNPPWRESDDSEKPTWETWCREQRPPFPIGRRQIAAGFTYRAMQCVHKTGVVALILPLNLVIGASNQSLQFRQRVIEDAHLERIINFGDVRRLLFPAAKHPCAIVRARPRDMDEGVIELADEMIEYWTPKTDVSLALGRLTLHAIDKKRLSAHEIHTQSYVLISSYWGERRDHSLLRRLARFGTLASAMKSRDDPWLSGKGFHKANNSNPNRSLGILEGLRFLPADHLPTEYPVIASDVQLPKTRDLFPIVASPGGQNGKLYAGPRVLFPDGLSNQYQIRASYTEEEFCFQSSVAAIGGVKGDADLLKFLSAYLRSPLASYLLIMTGYSVIGERPRVAVEDIEAFPFCSPQQHTSPTKAAMLVKQVSRLMDELAKISEWQRHHRYGELREEIDRAVFAYFGLSDSEEMLVKDTVKYIAASIQPGTYEDLATPLLHRPLNEELAHYAEVFRAELARWRDSRKGTGAVNVEVLDEGVSGFFGIVRVSTAKGSDVSASARTSREDFRALISDLRTSLAMQLTLSREDDLFHVPDVVILVDDAFYFIKPMRRRFWLGRTAISDAEHIVRTVQAASWQKVH